MSLGLAAGHDVPGGSVTRAQNLRDVLAAYGGYLGVLLTPEWKVGSLALQAPGSSNGSALSSSATALSRRRA